MYGPIIVRSVPEYPNILSLYKNLAIKIMLQDYMLPLSLTHSSSLTSSLVTSHRWQLDETFPQNIKLPAKHKWIFQFEPKFQLHFARKLPSYIRTKYLSLQSYFRLWKFPTPHKLFKLNVFLWQTIYLWKVRLVSKTFSLIKTKIYPLSFPLADGLRNIILQ